MTICFISHSSKTGGAERVLLETIEILQEQGLVCKVLLPSHGDLCAELRRLGVPFAIISFPLWMVRGGISFFGWVKTVLGTILNAPIVAWKIHQWKCDVVYSNTVTFCVGALASAVARRPHVWHLHEFGLEDQGLSFLFGERISLKIVNRFSSRCICVSKVLAKKYEASIESSKISVIYPSMLQAIKEARRAEIDRTLPLRDGRFRCVIVGALMEGKGQEDSVMAIAELKRGGIDAELMIVGEGLPPYRRHLEELVTEHRLENQVTLVGQIKSGISAMQSADAVLVCSRSEAFGRVTIEAMLAGVPVVGANSGATAELIKDGTTGLLYRSGDPQDLAEKIRCLRHSPAFAEMLAKNGQVWAENVFTKVRYSYEMGAFLKPLLPCVPFRTGAVPTA
jgi:glycosyltransferase involved in cell wall biosynthesis